MSDQEETSPAKPEFDFSAYPPDTLFLDRRTLGERRGHPSAPDPPPAPVAAVPRPPAERRARKERRRRIDPTTFEKQYTPDEMEFMTAVQRFKVQSGKTFPSHTDILGIAHGLGYRQFRDLDVLSEDELPALSLGPESSAELSPT